MSIVFGQEVKLVNLKYQITIGCNHLIRVPQDFQRYLDT